MPSHVPGRAPRWLSVGHSTEQDSARAGAEAAAAAITGDDAKLLVVFCSETYDQPALLAAINEVSGGIPLIGCSSAGEITPAGPLLSSVVITAIGGTGFSVTTSVATSATGRQRDAGGEVAACADQLSEWPYRALLLLVDGGTPEQEEILRGVYGVVGASIPLVGGCAGSCDGSRPTQFYGHQVLTDAVVAAAIGSPAPIGIAARHGWSKVGDAMTVTGSQQSRVLTFNDKPALDAYLDRLGAPPEAYHDLNAFTQFADTRPLGIRRRSGDEVRDVHGEPNFVDRSLHCGGEITQGGMVWCMEGDAESAMQATDDACQDALVALDGQPPIGLLAFDCVSRRGLFGDPGVDEEVRRIAKYADGAPVAGFYTWGEIARTRGINGFHHQTFVVLAMA